MKRRKLTPAAKHIIVSRLGETADELHEQAREYDAHAGGQNNRTSLTSAMREAADFLSDIRREIQR